MEEQSTPSSEYLKGFNEGYLLSKEASTIADRLSKIPGDSERIIGFMDGRRQFVLEKVHDLRKDRTVGSSSKETKEKPKDMEQDLEKE